MFYSQFILAKKGPLGTIWIAAHLERKLRKNQVADTDIGVSVDSILFPEVPIALRLSSHLLLGVVRIYSRKVGYLFDDCSEALLKVKQAFRSTAVDLSPEESTAPYHSITLPETFDLDDFELPDNENFQGNYVDHHISSREQITLQDNMEGVVYTTSQFGLDERFGDGDTSQIGLDLDEGLFLDKITVNEHDGIDDTDPQAPSPSTVLEDENENTKEILETFETMEVPSTPRRVDECNLSSIQACDDPLELENHGLIEQGAAGIKTNESRKLDIHGDPSNASDWSSHGDLDLKTARPPEENGHLSSDPETKDGMLEQLSAPTDESTEKIKGGELDGPSTGEDMNNGVVINNGPGLIFVDQVDAESDPSRPASGGTIMSPSRSGVTPDLENVCHKAPSDNNYALASDGCLIGDQASLKPIDSSGVLSPGKVDMDMSRTFQEDSPGRPEVIDDESKEVQEPKDTETQNSFEILSMEKPVFQACNSRLIERDRSSPEGESCQATDAEINKEKSEKPDAELSGGRQTDCRDSSKQLDCALYNDMCAENSIRSPTCDFPAPEKLLSVPEGITERPDNLPLESSLDKENLIEDEGAVSGANLISGKKRSFTESTLTAQSLNSAESVGVDRSKRIAESIPDDDDLLSSILVGRLSSVLKLKPSPPVYETKSLKRPRSALRVGASKRKVLMDDMMVLHGDTIRLQLTSTEDIRRVRKKAPCTGPEISIIQRQFLEDEIFSESIYAGISKELLLLHTEAFDLSEIIVYDKDPVSTSNEAANDFESAIKRNGTEESATETNTESLIGRNDLESQPAHVSVHNESGEIRELTVGCSDLDVLEQQASLTKNAEFEPLGERANMEIGAGNIADAENGFIIQELELPSLVIENKYDDPNVSLQMDISCFSPGKILDSQPEVEYPFTMNTENIGLDTVNANDSAEIRNDVYTKILDSQPEVGDPFTLNTENVGLDTANANDSAEIRNDVYTEILDSQPEVGDPFRVNTENIGLDTVNVNDSAEIRNDIYIDKSKYNVSLVTSPPEKGECSFLTPQNGDKTEESILNVKLGGIDADRVHMEDFDYDDKDPASVCLIDGAKMDSQYPSGFSMDFKSSSYEGVNPDDPEADLLNIVDAEITTLDCPTAEDRCDFEDATVAYDTEFLNVDDAEDDEGDDNMQFAADASFLENSGWSSRTRAVARYLQNLFDKEAIHGRKVLHLDNLLINKTRKEASRMFFETLVLKTKDYLHAEQEKPFDNISLKPRINLMKSNF